MKSQLKSLANLFQITIDELMGQEKAETIIVKEIEKKSDKPDKNKMMKAIKSKLKCMEIEVKMKFF